MADSRSKLPPSRARPALRVAKLLQKGRRYDNVAQKRRRFYDRSKRLAAFARLKRREDAQARALGLAPLEPAHEAHAESESAPDASKPQHLPPSIARAVKKQQEDASEREQKREEARQRHEELERRRAQRVLRKRDFTARTRRGQPALGRQIAHLVRKLEAVSGGAGSATAK
jgi:hypothetical protein